MVAGLAYPPAFRRDVGLGLVDALDDRMRARRADGASLIGARLPAMADTVRNAPIEWIATLRETRPQVRLKPDTTGETDPGGAHHTDPVSVVQTFR